MARIKAIWVIPIMITLTCAVCAYYSYFSVTVAVCLTILAIFYYKLSALKEQQLKHEELVISFHSKTNKNDAMAHIRSLRKKNKTGTYLYTPAKVLTEEQRLHLYEVNNIRVEDNTKEIIIWRILT